MSLVRTRGEPAVGYSLCGDHVWLATWSGNGNPWRLDLDWHRNGPPAPIRQETVDLPIPEPPNARDIPYEETGAASHEQATYPARQLHSADTARMGYMKLPRAILKIR